MKIAAIQLDSAPMDVMTNVRNAMYACRQAFLNGAHMIFLHEGLTADYSPEPLRYGRALESVEVHGFAVLAKQFDGYIALGLNEVWRDQAFISCVYLGPTGVVDVYRKSFLWSGRNRDNCVPYEMGYRQELGILSHGDGPRVVNVGRLRVGTLICADGDVQGSWDVFRRDVPDLVFHQCNQGFLRMDYRQAVAREIERPMVVTNRVGFSYHHFQTGGTRIVRRDGSIAVAANTEGREQTIYANLEDL